MLRGCRACRTCQDDATRKLRGNCFRAIQPLVTRVGSAHTLLTSSLQAAFHDTDTNILERNLACRCRCRGMRPYTHETVTWRRYAPHRMPSICGLFRRYSLEQNRFIRPSLRRSLSVRCRVVSHARPIPIDRISYIRRDRNGRRTNDCFRFVTLLRMTTDRSGSPSDSRHPLPLCKLFQLNNRFAPCTGHGIICQPLQIVWFQTPAVCVWHTVFCLSCCSVFMHLLFSVGVVNTSHRMRCVAVPYGAVRRRTLTRVTVFTCRVYGLHVYKL